MICFTNIVKLISEDGSRPRIDADDRMWGQKSFEEGGEGRRYWVRTCVYSFSPKQGLTFFRSTGHQNRGFNNLIKLSTQEGYFGNLIKVLRCCHFL